MNWKVMIIFILVLAQRIEADKYYVRFHDCRSPVNIIKYDKESICKKKVLQKEEDTNQDFALLLKPETKKLTGFSCLIKRSTYHYRCGAWSHLKVSRIPEIRRVEPISVPQCQEMVRKRTFEPKQSKIRQHLQINRPLYIQIETRGSFQESDDEVSCKGETYIEDGITHSNQLTFTDYEVVIENQDFIMNEYNKVESLTDKISLGCAASQLGCPTGQKTYIWKLPENKCRLKYIQTFQPKKILGTFMVDHQKKLFLNNTGISRQVNCNFNFYSTQYPTIYFTQSHTISTKNLPQIEPEDVNVLTQLNSKLEYLEYTFERNKQEEHSTIISNLCLQEKLSKEGTIQLKNNLYGHSTGDLFFTYNCTIKEEEIKDDSQCYTDVPLATGGFMNIEKKLFIQHSTIRHCNKLYPLTVKNTNNQFIALLPHPQLQPEPHIMKGDKLEPITHLSYAKGGIFTPTEIEMWREIQEYPVYHSALLAGLSYGSCVNTGTCTGTGTNEVVRYDFGRLHVPGLEPFSIISSLKKWVNTSGAYISLVALLIFGVKLLFDIMLIITALFKRAPAIALALLINTCSTSYQTYTTYRRQEEEMKRQMKKREEMEMTPLQQISTNKYPVRRQQEPF